MYRTRRGIRSCVIPRLVFLPLFDRIVVVIDFFVSERASVTVSLLDGMLLCKRIIYVRTAVAAMTVTVAVSVVRVAG